MDDVSFLIYLKKYDNNFSIEISTISQFCYQIKAKILKLFL